MGVKKLIISRKRKEKRHRLWESTKESCLQVLTPSCRTDKQKQSKAESLRLSIKTQLHTTTSHFPSAAESGWRYCGSDFYYEEVYLHERKNTSLVATSFVWFQPHSTIHLEHIDTEHVRPRFECNRSVSRVISAASSCHLPILLLPKSSESPAEWSRPSSWGWIFKAYLQEALHSAPPINAEHPAESCDVTLCTKRPTNEPFKRSEAETKAAFKQPTPIRILVRQGTKGHPGNFQGGGDYVIAFAIHLRPLQGYKV